MKQFFLSLCIFAFSAVYAIDNNVELLVNGDFSGAALVSQASIVATDASGAWIVGDNTKTAFTPTISGSGAEAYFNGVASAAPTQIFDHFLGQISNETLNTGRYRLTLKVKGNQAFNLKLSTVDAIGAELPFLLKNKVVTAPVTIDNSGAGGYSIKVTPTTDWTTVQTDIDLTIATPNKLRLFIVFPNGGDISLDDISLMRIADLVVYNSYYLRPAGDNTSWNNLTGINPDQIIEGTNFIFSSDKTYYLSAGNYTSSGTINLSSGKIYGGFSGAETAIDINSRQLSDKDANGIVEPWEFTNESVITTATTTARFAAAGTNSFRFLIVSGTGAEVNGVTLNDFYYTTYAGPICLGKVATTPAAGDNIESLAGTLRFCTVKKIKASASGCVMTTNQYSLIDRCLIEENVALLANAGGAVHMNLFGGKVSGSVIRNNTSSGGSGRGGAIYAHTSAATGDLNAIVENCVIYNNAATNGGALRAEAQTGKRGMQVVNSTIANNTTTGSGASVEFITAGFIANSIVVNPALSQNGTEVRCNAANSYFSNTIYGDSTYTAGGTKSGNMAPKLTSDIKFVASTTFSGPMIPGYTTPFVQATYDAIRQANFKIDPTFASASPAIIGASLKTLPANYTYTGGATAITITATIPTTDLMSVSRPVSSNGHLDLGAYQYSSLTTATQSNLSDKTYCLSVDNGIVINNANGLTVNVYAVSGQVVKSLKAVSGEVNIALPKGVYIVKSNKFIEKVIVR